MAEGFDAEIQLILDKDILMQNACIGSHRVKFLHLKSQAALLTLLITHESDESTIRAHLEFIEQEVKKTCGAVRHFAFGSVDSQVESFMDDVQKLLMFFQMELTHIQDN
jgi:hypothetical protein